MSLITGIVNGTVITTKAGETVLLPFANSIEEATFTYTGELVMSETFNFQGVKAASAACLMREEARFEFTSKNIVWNLLQVATGFLSDTVTEPIQQVESGVLRTVAANVSTFTLSKTPVAGQPITVADTSGNQYDVTVVGSVVTFDEDFTGTQISVSYFAAASTGEAAERQIQIGRSERITGVGLYGRFRSCGKDLLVIAKNAIIEPNLELAVGSDAASATATAICLQDQNGILATIIELND